MKNNLTITKASGEKSVFSEKKLRNSLQRAGATHNQIGLIIDEINKKLYEGISTKKIYQWAFALLRENSRHLAARYHLKRGIMELGPSGFSFEKFVGEILKYQGYTITVGEVVSGKCVTHEIDVLAKKNQHQFLIECKYHNQPGTFSDVKVPLYIQSRFLDVLEEWKKKDPAKTYQGWVVTNTRFSNDAIQYGTCAGLHLMGWDYPVKGSLKDQIDELGLYPITCLTSLTRVEKQRLLDKNIVLCIDLKKNESLLADIISKRARIAVILKEVEQLCQHLTTNENGERKN
ncbi:MAG: restriction endonuclease [Flavobacteriales bacterium]